MIVTLEHIEKSFGATLILDDITARVDDHDRIGLVGVNGAGKSTLLNIIYGDLVPEEGILSFGSGKEIGFLRQDSGLSDGTIQSEMESVFQHLYDMELTMRHIEETMGEISPDSEEYARLSIEYSSLQTQFESAEGYQIHVKINTVLNGMGFADADRSTPVGVLSGGERTRLAICKLLLESPDLLILDEPTNHLDFSTLVWLEEYLLSYPGALLIVSHDRYFLNTVCHSIWELQNRELTVYKGNYDKYLVLKEERETQLLKQYELQQQEIKEMEDFIARNIVRASTTGRAQSRRKALERMERIEAPKLPPKPPKIRFTHKRDSVKDVLEVEDLALSVGEDQEEKQLFQSLNLSLSRGEKIALVGPNGVGKSTFLKALIGQVTPDKGTITWGRNTDVSYFDQGVGGMDVTKRAIDQLWDAYPLETEHTIRSILGRAGLSGEAVFKKVDALSGGERARLKFAHFMMECGNVLLMDEPTNHLDLPTKEELDTALSEYTGTLFVVSHDRYLLNKFPDKIAELTEQGLVLYPGKYDDYRKEMVKQQEEEARLAEAISLEEQEQERDEKRKTAYRTREDRRAAAERRQRLSKLEKKIPLLETAVEEISQLIAQPEVATDYQRMEEECNRLEEKRKRLDEALTEWAMLAEQQAEES